MADRTAASQPGHMAKGKKDCISEYLYIASGSLLPKTSRQTHMVALLKIAY